MKKIKLLMICIFSVGVSSAFFPTYVVAKKTKVVAEKAQAAGENIKITGTEILKQSDDKLIPLNCSYDLSLETIKNDSSENLQVMYGFKNGNEQNVMVVKEPKRIAGSAHLKNSGVIWSYHTTNHRTTKMAYQAVFMGTLLNYGDIMATELSVDYKVFSARIVGDEYQLVLKPKPNKDSYGKIEVIIDKKTLLPKSRDYYALSGILLKKCKFIKSEHDSDGKLTYLEMDFLEPIKNRKTVVKFTNIKTLKESEIPNKYFNENFLSKIGRP